MINPAFLIGEPLLFKEGLYIYPPRVKDVVANPNYNTFLRILTISPEDIRDELKIDPPPTPFEFMLANCYQHQQIQELTEAAFWFFCHKKIRILYEEKKVIFLADGTNIELREEEYFNFQNAILSAIGDKPRNPPEPTDPDEDPRIRRIKEKARQRDRIKAKQAGKNGISLDVILTAICCMGIGITPLNIGEMSYASIGAIMKMMQDKEKYDIDIRSLLAGASSKKVKPKYWIRNTND